MSDTTDTKPQIVIKRKYKHPVDKVWRAITSKRALSEWLMETNDFEVSVGTRFQFRTTPRGKFDGIINCQVLEVNDPERIRYSWRAKGMTQPTIVTWHLRELTRDQTLLTLTHDGFEGFNGWMTQTMLRFGWKKLLSKKLEKYLSK